MVMLTTPLNLRTFEQPIVRNNAKLGFEILKTRVDDARCKQKTHPKKTSHHQQSIVDQKWYQTGYWKEAESLWSKKNQQGETIAEYVEARRQVKIFVKQEKRNTELSIPKICKHNPKSFYSYINERKIARDNIGPLKTLDGIVITTDNGMVNTVNNYFYSVFTIKHGDPTNNDPTVRPIWR